MSALIARAPIRLARQMRGFSARPDRPETLFEKIAINTMLTCMVGVPFIPPAISTINEKKNGNPNAGK